MRRPRAGDVVLVRELTRGRIHRAAPWLVVDETARQLVLFLPRGSASVYAPVSRLAQAAAPPAANVEKVDSLRIVGEGDPYSTLLWWRQGVFVGWYVNFERRTPSALGWDYVDHELDLFVEPDRSWRLLDEDEFEEAQRLGLLSAADAVAVRDDAAGVIDRVKRWQPPFSDGWESWRPDRELRRPLALPAGWDLLD